MQERPPPCTTGPPGCRSSGIASWTAAWTRSWRVRGVRQLGCKCDLLRRSWRKRGSKQGRSQWRKSRDSVAASPSAATAAAAPVPSACGPILLRAALQVASAMLLRAPPRRSGTTMTAVGAKSSTPRPSSSSCTAATPSGMLRTGHRRLERSPSRLPRRVLARARLSNGGTTMTAVVAESSIPRPSSSRSTAAPPSGSERRASSSSSSASGS